jgi:hypothetical protein
MASQRRRVLTQRRRRRNCRLKASRLTPLEQSRLAEAKRLQSRARFLFVADRHLSAEPADALNFFMGSYNSKHRRDFAEDVILLSGEFPGEEILVLDDGPGKGHFGRELKKEVRNRTKGQVRVKVLTLDIDPRRKPDFVGSPEQLVRFLGRNKVHLVVSTFGGTTYTGVNQVKAVSNIADVLKPGGFASILSEDGTSIQKRLFEGWRRGPPALLDGRAVSQATLKKALKNRPDISKTFNTNAGLSLVVLKKRK